MKEGREGNASETVRVMAMMTVILMPAAIIIEKHNSPSSALGAECVTISFNAHNNPKVNTILSLV